MSLVSQDWFPRLGQSMNTAFFSDLLASISERGRALLGRKEIDVDPTRRAAGVIDLCEAVLSGRGEASGAALACAQACCAFPRAAALAAPCD